MRNLIRGSFTEAKARKATLKLLDEIEQRCNVIKLLWEDLDNSVIDDAEEIGIQTVLMREVCTQYWRDQDDERKAGGE